MRSTSCFCKKLNFFFKQWKTALTYFCSDEKNLVSNLTVVSSYLLHFYVTSKNKNKKTPQRRETSSTQKVALTLTIQSFFCEKSYPCFFFPPDKLKVDVTAAWYQALVIPTVFRSCKTQMQLPMSFPLWAQVPDRKTLCSQIWSVVVVQSALKSFSILKRFFSRSWICKSGSIPHLKLLCLPTGSETWLERSSWECW